MVSDTDVLRAAARDPAALQTLLVADLPYMRKAARRFAAWCHDDVVQDASQRVLTGFRSFKLPAAASPSRAWRRWLRAVTRNAAIRLSKKLARGSSQSIAEAEAIMESREGAATGDLESAYDAVRAKSFECMPLGARFAWMAQEQRISANQLGRKLALRGDRGAHYHTNLARKLVREIAAREEGA